MRTIQKRKKTPIKQAKSLLLSLFSTKTSRKKKLMAAAIVVYIISPFDVIPDFVPLAGYADDVVLPILLILADKLLSDNRERQTSSTIKEAEKV
ncbi:MAG: YkvA family protein [Carnobacterium sp.]